MSFLSHIFSTKNDPHKPSRLMQLMSHGHSIELRRHLDYDGFAWNNDARYGKQRYNEFQTMVIFMRQKGAELFLQHGGQLRSGYKTADGYSEEDVYRAVMIDDVNNELICDTQMALFGYEHNIIRDDTQEDWIIADLFLRAHATYEEDYTSFLQSHASSTMIEYLARIDHDIKLGHDPSPTFIRTTNHLPVQAQQIISNFVHKTPVYNPETDWEAADIFFSQAVGFQDDYNAAIRKQANDFMLAYLKETRIVPMNPDQNNNDELKASFG